MPVRCSVGAVVESNDSLHERADKEETQGITSLPG